MKGVAPQFPLCDTCQKSDVAIVEIPVIGKRLLFGTIAFPWPAASLDDARWYAHYTLTATVTAKQDQYPPSPPWTNADIAPGTVVVQKEEQYSTDKGNWGGTLINTATQDSHVLTLYFARNYPWRVDPQTVTEFGERSCTRTTYGTVRTGNWGNGVIANFSVDIVENYTEEMTPEILKTEAYSDLDYLWLHPFRSSLTHIYGPFERREQLSPTEQAGPGIGFSVSSNMSVPHSLDGMGVPWQNSQWMVKLQAHRLYRTKTPLPVTIVDTEYPLLAYPVTGAPSQQLQDMPCKDGWLGRPEPFGRTITPAEPL